MTQNIIEVTMYTLIHNYSSSMAEMLWDMRKDNEDDGIDSRGDVKVFTKDLEQLLSPHTAKQTVRRLFSEGMTAMLVGGEIQDKLEKWEVDGADYTLVIHEGLRFTSPFTALTRSEISW